MSYVRLISLQEDNDISDIKRKLCFLISIGFRTKKEDMSYIPVIQFIVFLFHRIFYAQNTKKNVQLLR